MVKRASDTNRELTELLFKNLLLYKIKILSWKGPVANDEAKLQQLVYRNIRQGQLAFSNEYSNWVCKSTTNHSNEQIPIFLFDVCVTYVSDIVV